METLEVLDGIFDAYNRRDDSGNVLGRHYQLWYERKHWYVYKESVFELLDPSDKELYIQMFRLRSQIDWEDEYVVGVALWIKVLIHRRLGSLELRDG